MARTFESYEQETARLSTLQIPLPPAGFENIAREKLAAQGFLGGQGMMVALFAGAGVFMMMIMAAMNRA